MAKKKKRNNARPAPTVGFVGKHRRGVRAKLHEAQAELREIRERLDATLRELRTTTQERDDIQPKLDQAFKDLVSLSKATEVLARRGV